MRQTAMSHLGKTAMAALVLTLGAGQPAAWSDKPESEQGRNLAMQLQQAFSTVAENAIPAVVVITNKQKRRAPDGGAIPPEMRRFFGLPDPEDLPDQEDAPPQTAGSGSGLIIRSDGYIVTNYHVVKDSDALEVRLHDGTSFDSGKDPDAVEIVGVDRETDLAVLRIGNGELDELKTLEFANSENIKVGEWAIAVGAPFNLDYSVTVGVVSQLGRYDMRMNTYENYIQTDASINPGNSGGPLLDIHGNVIGINDFIVTGGGMSRGNVGVGFAISSNLVRQIVDDLIENKKVIRPWLGIAMQELTPELADQFAVDSGVLISEVMEDDPADKAGLQPGDVILKVGDKRVKTPHDVQFAVLAYDPGEEIPLTFNRNGKRKNLTVVPRRKGGDPLAATTDGDLLDRAGLQLQKTDQGVVIADIKPGSPADAARLQRGDLILSVNREPVESVEDASAALGRTQGNMAVIYADRKGRKFFAPLQLKEN
ncbi:MAG: trypsin-like peptidase domain-containing protein [Verrucomicrobiota bacterium]